MPLRSLRPCLFYGESLKAASTPSSAPFLLPSSPLQGSGVITHEAKASIAFYPLFFIRPAPLPSPYGCSAAWMRCGKGKGIVRREVLDNGRRQLRPVSRASFCWMPGVRRPGRTSLLPDAFLPFDDHHPPSSPPPLPLPSFLQVTSHTTHHAIYTAPNDVFWPIFPALIKDHCFQEDPFPNEQCLGGDGGVEMAEERVEMAVERVEMESRDGARSARVGYGARL